MFGKISRFNGLRGHSSVAAARAADDHNGPIQNDDCAEAQASASGQVRLLTREEFAKIQQFRRTVKSLRRAVQTGVKRTVTAMAICATALAGVQLQAAPYYWDTDSSLSGNLTTGEGLGGSGTWDPGATNWWDGASIVTWTNTFTDEAVFSGPTTGLPYTVTVNPGVQANALSFLRSGYTLTGSPLLLGGIDPSIYVSLAESATIAAPLTGSSGLTLNGGGTLRLTGDNSGLTGAVTIAGGSLVINSPGALPGTGSIRVTAGNGTPSNGNLVGFTGGSLVLDGTAGGFTLARDLNLEGRGVIGNNGAALLSLGGNTLTGIVTTASSLQTPATFRNTRINSVNGTLTLAGTLNVLGTAISTVTTLGGVNTAGVGNFDLSGVLQGTGSIEKAGAGTLFFNPSNTSGFSATVRIAASATGQQSSLRVTQATVGGTSIFGTNAGTGANSTVDMGGGVLEIRSDSELNFGKNVYARSSSTFFGGPAAGGAGVNGAYTFGNYHQVSNITATFNSRNGYGFTFGTWTQENSNNNAAITNNMGGTLTFTGNAWNNSDASARTLTIGGNGNTVIQGSINSSGAGAKTLAKSGTGSLTIAGTATTLNGSVRVTAGAVIVTDFRSLNNNEAEISLGNATTTAGHLIIGGTGVAATAEGLTTSKTITLNTTTASNSIYANQDGTAPVILNGAITKIGTATTGNLILGGTNTADNTVNVSIPAGTTGGLVKLGSGTWVLAAQNGYTGVTTIQNGVLKLHATGGASDVIGAGGVTFNADGVTQSAAGALEFRGFLDTDTTEELGALTPGAGAVKIVTTANGTGSAALTFASLAARAGGAAIDYQVGANTSIFFTTAPTVGNGILGATGTSAFQTFNGVDWATLSGNQVVAYTGYTALLASFSGTGGANVQYAMTEDSATTGTASVSTIKFVGGAGNPTLTLNGTLTLTQRAILFDNSAGTATITGSQLGASATEVHVIANGSNPANALAIASLIGGTTGSFTKSGTGTVVVSGDNTFTGNVIINEGVVRLSGATATLGVNSTVGNSLTIRQGGTLDVNGAGAAQTIGLLALQGAGVITNSGGGNGTSVTISLGRSTSTTATIFSGVLQDGDLQNGGGVLHVTIDGARTQALIGDNTYTGMTTIGTTAQLTVDWLANGGLASGIGAASSAAGNLVFDGAAPTLIYRGNIRIGSLNLGSTSATTDRLFTISGAGAVLSSAATNNNTIVWSNFGAIVHGTDADRTLTLTGTSTGDNTFNPQLTDSSFFSITSLTKTGAGQWNLGNTDNTYTGATTINEGVLALNANGALSVVSPLYLTPTSASSVAVLQMSGVFERELSSSLIVLPGTNTVTFGFSAASTTGGVGFAAHSGPLTVAIGGSETPTALAWAAGGFVGTGGVQNLVLNSTTALSYVDFRNAIDLGDSQRTVNVLDNTNTGADYAIMSGVLSGAGGGLRKIGGGILTLTGANTYTGVTAVEGGTLRVTSLGNSGNAPNTATSVGTSGTAMNNTNAVTLGTGTTGVILQYLGPGETTNRRIRLNSTGTNQLHADGSGAWIIADLANDMVAGARTLALRGSNVAGNMITSQLSDNGGALTITVDGGATWILTNSNNYTGTTTVSAGALGIGHDSAIGAGLAVGNGNVFAYNGDRTLTNALTLTSNATNGWMGNYSLTFNGVNTMTGTTSSLTLTTINSISAGKSLTINGMSSVATAARNWNFDGPGETNLNGVFTSAAGVNLIKTGDGTLVLGTDGAASNWNQGNTNVDIDRGTLRFTANDAIPSLAGHGGLIVSPELLTGDVAIIDLSGTSQTVNALTMTSDGTVVIDNTSASAATFRFGANNSAISFGTGLGSYTVQNTGAGGLSLVKLGNTNITFGSNLVLNHQGTTAVEGGSLTIAAAVNGTTGLRVSNSGSALTLSGGITAPEAITSVIVEGGTTLSLLDGAGNQIINLTNLQLGSSGGTMTTLNFNVGDSLVAGDELGTDLLQLLSGGTLSLFAGNQITLNLTDVGLSANQTYDLIRLVGGGGLTSGPLSQSDWILGNAPGGFSSMTLVRNDDRIYLQTGNLITQTQYWRGLTNTRWNGALDNWSLDKAGTTPVTTLPGAGTDVIFQWNAPTNAAVTTTLEQNFRINSLTFEPAAIPANTPTSVTINPGDLPTSRLDVAPGDNSLGVTIEAGGPASVTIAAAFRLGADQTWDVADAGSTLTFSGALFGEAEVTKTGLGTVVLAGVADPTFNVGQSTNFFVNEGKLIVTNVAALGNTVNNNLARVFVNSGGLFSFSGAASTLPVPIVLNGGTLAAAGNTQTYSGLVTVASDSTILMLDPLLVTPTGRSITLSGGLSDSGTLTVDGIATITEGNQETGTLTINQDNSAWTGNWNLLRGSVSTNNADGLGAGSLITAEKGRILFTGTARTQTIGHDILIAGATEASVLEFNFATGISGIFSGGITLGGAGGFGELRVHMSTDADTAVITGGVVLANNGGLGVRDAATRYLHVDSVISEIGGSRSLRINHQAWGGTAGTVRLTGLNTFSGDVVVARGALEFNTVTNAGGAASSLGQGNTITLGAGAASILRFIGDGAANSQITNRAINITPDSTTNYAGTLAANGINGATITYTGPINVTPNADGSWLVLTGLPGSQGFITGGITTVGTTGDMSVTNGTWTIQDGLITIADDIFVTGENAVLNLNSTGVWTATSPAGTSSGLYMRAGGTINLGANDINGANNANGLDFIMVGMDSTVGFTSTFNTNGFNITTPRLDVGGIADLTGNVLGSGTITNTYTGTDYGQGFRFFRGSVEANLAGVATILKQGLGKVTLSGNNSGLTGTVAPTRIDSGTLILDFTTQNNNKISSAAQLDMRGATLILNGNASASTSQSVTSTTIAGGSGSNRIVLNAGAGQEIVLNLGAISRGVNSQDGTLRIVLPSGTQSATNGVTTTTALTNGLVGTAAYLTVEDGTGTWFATKSGNNIVAMISTAKNDVATWLDGDHITDETTGFTGTFSGVGVNSLRFNAATGSYLNLTEADVLGIATGGILVTGNVTGGAGILGGTLFSGAAATTPEVIVTHDGSGIFEIGADLRINTILMKTGTGTLRLSGNNSTSGLFELQSGGLQLAGGNAIGDFSLLTFSDDSQTFLELLADETIGRLQGGSASDGMRHLATLAVGTHQLTINQTSSTTYAGVFTGNGTIVKNGAGNLQLTNSSVDFTGSIVVESGTFYFTTFGSTAASSITVNRGGALLFDKNGSTGPVSQVADGAAVVLNSADGAFLGQATVRGLSIRSDNSATRDELFGLLTFNSGASYVGMEATVASADSDIIATDILRLNNATLNVRGANLGTTNATSNQLRIGDATNQTAFLANSANLVGGGGAAGTKNISIVPWAIGETIAGATALASGNMGNSLVTYVSGTGFRPLDFATEYNPYAAAAATDNMRESLAASLTGLSGKTVNSFVLNNEATAAINFAGTGAGQALNITSGAMLFTLTGAVADGFFNTQLAGFDSGITTGSLGEYIIQVVNPNVLISFGAGGATTFGSTRVTASSTATLQVGMAVYGAGIPVGAVITNIVSGTAFEISLPANLSASNQTYQYTANGGLMATISSPLTSTADITKSGRGTLVLSGVNTAGGGTKKTVVNEGILEISDLDNIGGNTGQLIFAGGTLRLGAGYTGDDFSQRLITMLAGGGTIDTNGLNLTLAGSLGSGVGGFTKLGLGNLTLNGLANYTGATTILAGTLTIGGDNATGLGGDLWLGSGAVLDLVSHSISAGQVTLFGSNPLLLGTGTINASRGFQFINTSDTTIEAALAGAGGVFKNQTSVLTLTALSTYAGITEIQAGTLVFDSIANVGGGASSLGAPTTVENGVIRMGLTTAATTLTYIGAGHSSNRLIGLQSTTGSVAINANGDGALGLGGARVEAAGNKTLILRGTSAAWLANSIGGIHDNGLAIVSVTKSDANTWVLDGTSSYRGTTTVGDGTFRITADQVLTGNLILGTATTAATLELAGADTQFAAFSVVTNSSMLDNTLTIAAGDTLTVTGNVLIGANANESETRLYTSGGGAFVVTNVGGTFQLGAATGTANENSATADFGGLSSFTVDLGNTGVMRIGDNSTNVNIGRSSILTLATDSTIEAGTLQVAGATTSSLQTVRLGSGTNVLKVETLQVGGAARGAGLLNFADMFGTLRLRGYDDVGAAVVNLAAGTSNAAQDFVATMDLSGHQADLLISTLTVASRSDGAGHTTAVFSFDEGVLDVGTLIMASRTGGTGASMATVNLGDGFLAGTAQATIDSLIMGTATGTGGIVTADLYISGGNVNIGTGSGTAINMANAATGRTVNSSISLIGGSTSVAGNIVRSIGAGTETATITLDGGRLDLNGNVIGASGGTINFLAQSGTLANLGQLNGGGALDKTTGGRLIMDGSNSYTGATNVNAGTMSVNGTISGAGTVTVAAGATFNGNGSVAGNTIVNGTLSAGSSPAGDNGHGVGGMTLAGGSTWNTGASFVFDFAAADFGATVPTVGSTDWDFLSIAGTGLTLASGASYTLSIRSWLADMTGYGLNGFNANQGESINLPEDPGQQASYRWLWVDVDGALSGDGILGGDAALLSQFTIDTSMFNGNSPLASSGNFWVSASGGDLYINYGNFAAVPEPSSLALVGLAGLGLAAYRRRKQTHARAEANLASNNESASLEACRV